MKKVEKLNLLRKELNSLNERIECIYNHSTSESCEELSELLGKKSHLENVICDTEHNTHRVKVEELYKKMYKAQLQAANYYNKSTDALRENNLKVHKIERLHYERVLLRINRYKDIIDMYDSIDSKILGVEEFIKYDKHIIMM